MEVIVSSYSQYKTEGIDTERSGGVRCPYSESMPRNALISKIPPPRKRWSHFVFMSKTAALLGLDGITILGFMGLFVVLEWCKSLANMGCGIAGYSCESVIPGTIECIGEIHGWRDIPVEPCDGDGNNG